MPDSGYYWKVIDLGSECKTGLSDTVEAIFRSSTILGDTVVDGKKYKKIFATDDAHNIIISRGYLFEDTLNRKVYVVTDDPDDMTITGDTLLYDFNISVGSSLDNLYEFRGFGEDHPANSTVFAMDSIEIEGLYRRRIGMQYELYQCDNKKPIKIDTIYWIEGLGSTLGFTTPNILPLNPQGEYVADVLACVISNATAIFVNNHTWHTCDDILISGLSIETMELKEIIWLSPQPAKDLLYIEISDIYLNDVVSIQIFDLIGNVVNQIEYIYNGKISLELNGIDSGIYILLINTASSNRFSRKLIMQH